MKRPVQSSGFALIVTLVMMALIVIIVVAYLANTRSDRSTSSLYANRLRAKMIADSGLTAATKLLYDNTKAGNYITAMPAPVPAPPPIRTELYRPDTTIPPDFLKLNNAIGEILASRVSAAPLAAPTPQVDPRPVATPLPAPPAGGSFGLTEPGPAPSSADSFDFNQIVLIGNNPTGRLVDPSGRPAFGQWIRVRNSAGELVGRYAFFIEDESMKVNVNVSGNNAGAGGTNMRSNDMTLPPSGSAPAAQIEEIDPGAVVPTRSPAPNRSLADTILAGLGGSGNRLSSRSTLGLLNEWNNSFPDYAHLTTVLSRDDNTTARGWQRLDLNGLVGGATSNTDKVAAANRIADWINDAWTGHTPITSLISSQIFGDDRLRKQLAANIVDYIDNDNVPTDMGDLPPSPGATPIPVIGIEKIPYIQAIEILLQASNTTPNPGNTPGLHTVTIRMKMQFRFLNLFGSDLDLADQIKTITVQGVPALTKNGSQLIDVSGQLFTVTVPQGLPPQIATDLRPVNGTGTLVPKGVDGTSSSGARTFQTDWLTTLNASYTVPSSSDQRPRFGSGTLNVRVLGNSNARLDVIAVNLTSQLTGYYYGSPSSGSTSYSSRGDFVEDTRNGDGSTRAPAPQIASISLTYGAAGTPNGVAFGDPRYRGPALQDRWEYDSRTDATTPPLSWITTPVRPDRISSYIDTAELNARGYAVDWFDYSGDRPLAFLRNGPMLNIGELGNVATCEYPWRTLYLQHPERPVNTSQPGPATDVPLRRSQSSDYVLTDIFRAGGTNTRSGAININTQQQFLPLGGSVTALPFESLFVGIPIGAPGAASTPQPLTQAGHQAAPSPADRFSTGVNLLVNSTTVPPPGSAFVGSNPLPYRIASVSNKRAALSGETATSDNNPTRPYFQIGELAPTLSRLTAASEASDTSSSSSTSHVVYSALRTNPQSTASANYKNDFQAEQAFRQVSNSITTRGNVFRVLYVGQTIKDFNHNAGVDAAQEIVAEYLAEAYVERRAVFTPDASNSNIVRTSDSSYKIIANRVITE